MFSSAEKTSETKSKAVANSVSQNDAAERSNPSSHQPGSHSGTKQLRSVHVNGNNSGGGHSLIQKKENTTGLPDQLKSGVESLSGFSMDDVKVHYNSPKPAQLQAHAYAQGTDIHLGAGQEKHLPHEAWHVVQQKQGRVNATAQLKEAVYVNDDTLLESEADHMGSKAMLMYQSSTANEAATSFVSNSTIQKYSVIQRAVWEHDGSKWNFVKGMGGHVSPLIEGLAGQVYDDLRQAFYISVEERDATEGIINGLEGGGNIQNLFLAETDLKGKQYGGFKAKIVSAITKLLQQPTGRALLFRLTGGGQTVTIRPGGTEDEASAGPSWRMNNEENGESGEWEQKDVKPGKGTDVTVLIPHAMNDGTMKTYNSDFELMDQPLFITLGHELIHAEHMTLGVTYAKSEAPLTDPEYTNLEEETTIDTGPVSENELRKEHGYAPRFGHDGVDTTDTKIKLDPLQSKLLGDVSRVLGVSIGAILEANPTKLDTILLSDAEIVKEFFRKNPLYVMKFRKALEAMKWRDIFKGKPKELETLMLGFGPSGFKGADGIKNKTFEELNGIDGEGFGQMVDAIQQTNIDQNILTPQATVGNLMRAEPQLKELINKYIKFIGSGDVDNYIERMTATEVGDGYLIIDDKYKMTELVMNYNPKFAIDLLYEEIGDAMIEKMEDGNTPEFKANIIKRFSGVNGIRLSGAYEIPGCSTHRITRAQAAQGPLSCITTLSQLYHVNPELLSQCNTSSGFTAGAKIIISSAWNA